MSKKSPLFDMSQEDPPLTWFEILGAVLILIVFAVGVYSTLWR